jgi:Flp pilus assembly protein TadB
VKLDRTRPHAPDPTLYWRVGLLFLGAGMWVAGVLYRVEWLTMAAIVVLGAGIVLRMAARRSARRRAADERADASDPHP